MIPPPLLEAMAAAICTEIECVTQNPDGSTAHVEELAKHTLRASLATAARAGYVLCREIDVVSAAISCIILAEYHERQERMHDAKGERALAARLRQAAEEVTT